jgi:hypothetical protein
MGTAGNLVNFGAAAMAGTAKVSDFFTAFKDLPIVGTVAGLFASLVKLQEENLEMFRSLSQNGINLGGNLSQLRDDAFSLGLTTQEYTQILKDNSESLVQMGGSASLGKKNFDGIAKAMKDGGLTRELLSLGFTVQEANNTIIQYAKTTGGISKQALADQAGLAVSAARYGKELDFLARLTGESRESIQKKLEEEAGEANWQAFMASKSQAERDKLTAGLQRYTVQFGKAGAQIFKAGAQGVAILGDEGQTTASLMGDLADTITKEAMRANDTRVSAEEYSASSTKTLAIAQIQSAKGYQRLAGTIQAMQLANDPMAASMGVHAKQLQTLTNSQGTLNLSVEENIIRLEEERKAAEITAATKKSEADELTAMQLAMKELGLELWRAMKPLMPLVFDIIRLAAEKIPEAGRQIEWFIKKLFSPEGRDEIMKKIEAFLKELFGKIWELVKPSWADTAGKVATAAGYTLAGAGAGAVTGAGIGMMGGPGGAAVGAIAGAVTGLATALWSMFTENKPGRSAGSYGTVGTAFENFGNGTPIIGHGIEGMFKPEQITHLMQASVSNALEGLVTQLNNTQAELVYQMRQVAENSRRNVQATENLSGNAFA